MHLPCMPAIHHLTAVFERAHTSHLAQENSGLADQLCFSIQFYTELISFVCPSREGAFCLGGTP